MASRSGSRSVPDQRAGRPLLRKPEPYLYALLLLVGIGTRLWDLGGRSLHYDELLHAWYSWRFAEGFGYSHTPLTHGPFLFHAAGGTFAVLGASDFTVRLVPAIFGTILIGMPFLLREWLGRAGALVASVILFASPSMLYFGRFARNDIYMAVWALGLVIVMWHYFRAPQSRLLVLWAALWALAYSTKESSYLLAGTFGLYLLVKAMPSLWAWVKGSAALSQTNPAGDLLLVLGTLSLPLWAPMLGLVQKLFGLILVNPDAHSPHVISGAEIRAAVETGAPAGAGLYVAFLAVVCLAVISVWIGMSWNNRLWPLLAIVFIGIWLALFTSLFTNWNGFFTGAWGSLGYWIAQQDVERAGQPIYYYLIGLSIYEFVALIPAVIGGIYLLVKGVAFDRFIVFWAAITFVLFSFAGERMPWLLVGITLPLAIVAGRTIGQLLTSLHPSKDAIWGLILGASVIAVGPIVASYTLAPDVQFDSARWWAVVILFSISLGGLAFRLAKSAMLSKRPGEMGVRSSRRVIIGATVGALLAMLLFSAFIAARSSFSYGSMEQPTDILVYSQTGQATSYTANCLRNVAQSSGRGQQGLRIVVDESDNFGWQWRWYLREYGAVEFKAFGKNDIPADLSTFDVVLTSKAGGRNWEKSLGNFTNVGDLHHLWWFPNSIYKGIGAQDLFRGLIERKTLSQIVDYFLFRKFEGRMYRSDGTVLMTDSLASQSVGCTSRHPQTG